MSDTPLLELEGISKFYGNIIALQGVTTEVRAGQVTCVLGDNGRHRRRVSGSRHGPAHVGVAELLPWL